MSENSPGEVQVSVAKIVTLTSRGLCIAAVNSRKSRSILRTMDIRTMDGWFVRRIRSCFLGLILSSCLIVTSVLAQSTAPLSESTPSSQTGVAAVPVVDAEMGPCSAEFTVTDPSFKPVRDARVRVRINYGFMGVRRLDLEVGTNADGKARFVGLPNNLKHALYFYAEQGKLRGTAVNDAALKCNASHTLTMRESAEAGDETSDDTTDKPENRTPDNKTRDKTDDNSPDKPQDKPQR